MGVGREKLGKSRERENMGVLSSSLLTVFIICLFTVLRNLLLFKII